MLGNKQGGYCNNPLTFPFLPSLNSKTKINFYTFISVDYKPICTLYVIALNVLCHLPYSAFTFAIYPRINPLYV